MPTPRQWRLAGVALVLVSTPLRASEAGPARVTAPRRARSVALLPSLGDAIEAAGDARRGPGFRRLILYGDRYLD